MHDRAWKWGLIIFRRPLPPPLPPPDLPSLSCLAIGFVPSSYRLGRLLRCSGDALGRCEGPLAMTPLCWWCAARWEEEAWEEWLPSGWPLELHTDEWLLWLAASLSTSPRTGTPRHTPAVSTPATATVDNG
jgi:hypothetical protein